MTRRSFLPSCSPRARRHRRGTAAPSGRRAQWHHPWSCRRGEAAGSDGPSILKRRWGGIDATGDTDPSQSVVYLERPPRGAVEQPEPGRATMNQRNEMFVAPRAGDHDRHARGLPEQRSDLHNVFSFSKAGRFDLGRYSVGDSKSVRFDQPGSSACFCEIHSHMNAFILVFSHRFFAMTDADGRYRIADVPPGRYNLIAWNEGWRWRRDQWSCQRGRRRSRFRLQ